MGIWGIGNAMLTHAGRHPGSPDGPVRRIQSGWRGNLRNFLERDFPMISPVIFYNLILSVVGLFQYFLVPLVLNQGTGAPGGASMFYNLYLYKTFFVSQNMSYGATLGWALFLVILITTVLLSRRPATGSIMPVTIHKRGATMNSVADYADPISRRA